MTRTYDPSNKQDAARFGRDVFRKLLARMRKGDDGVWAEAWPEIERGKIVIKKNVAK